MPHHKIETVTQKWRFVCPRSAEHPSRQHTNWFPLNGIIRCRSCEDERAAGEDVDPDYDELWDQREERFVPREEIELATRPKGKPHAD